MLVLGIDVDEDLLDRWRGWVMPERHPYAIGLDLAGELGVADRIGPVSPELRDSFDLYGLGNDVVVWLTLAESGSLPAEVRAAQPGAHRRPSRDPVETIRRVVRFVENGRKPSRHKEVDATTWHDLADLLPNAASLAGTFPERSGPNCFGTVMAAAGVAGAELTWMQREPFEGWLAEHTVSGGCHEEAGTVLVWRDSDGLVQHAALTLGGGWVLHKPSQGWMSPTKVLRVGDITLSSRAPGRYLRRYRLRQGLPVSHRPI